MRSWLLVVLGCLAVAGCGDSRPAPGVTTRDAVVDRLTDLGFAFHKDETVHGKRIIEFRKQEGEASVKATATDHYTMVHVSVPVDAVESEQRVATAMQSAESVVDSIVGAPVCATLYSETNQVDATGGVPRAEYETIYLGREISVARYLSVRKGASDVSLAMFFIRNAPSPPKPSSLDTEPASIRDGRQGL